MGRCCRKGSRGGWPSWTPHDGAGGGGCPNPVGGVQGGLVWAGMGVGMGMGFGMRWGLGLG